MHYVEVCVGVRGASLWSALKYALLTGKNKRLWKKGGWKVVAVGT